MKILFDFEDYRIIDDPKVNIVLIHKKCSFTWSLRYGPHEELVECRCFPSDIPRDVELLYRLLK